MKGAIHSAAIGMLLLFFAPAARATDSKAEADVFMNTGYQFSLKGDRVHCDENYKKAFALNPKGPGYRVSYGWALLNLGDYEGALAVWHKAFTGIDRNYGNQAVCQALAHYRLGHLEQAVDWYQVQCLGNHDFTSMEGMRFLSGYWQIGEKQALEAVYKLWLKADDRAGRLLPRLQAKERELSKYEKNSAATPALGTYEFQVQQHLDQYFLKELKSVRFLTHPDKQLSLGVTLRPDGKIDVDSVEVDKLSLAEPVYSIAILRALATLAENPVSFPRDPAFQIEGFKFRALFEVQLKPE